MRISAQNFTQFVTTGDANTRSGFPLCQSEERDFMQLAVAMDGNRLEIRRLNVPIVRHALCGPDSNHENVSRKREAFYRHGHHSLELVSREIDTVDVHSGRTEAPFAESVMDRQSVGSGR